MANKIVLSPPYSEVPYLSDLATRGIECDQLLAEAIRRASLTHGWGDDLVVCELANLGGRALAQLNFSELIQNQHADRLSMRSSRAEVKKLYYDIDRVDSNLQIFETVPSGSLTASDFLQRLVTIIYATGDSFPKRPHSADMFARALSGDGTTSMTNVPEMSRFVGLLPTLATRADDVEFILALDAKGRIRFRSTGHMGDYVQDAGSGLWVPNRAMLVHHQTFGSFTIEQIQELEDLINDPRAREEKFQAFFERYPHFFRRWDHRAVHPHVYLTREEDADGPLIPDFILTNAEAQQAFVLDLKLPTEKVIRAQKNRDRFSVAVMEAKAQLETYRDWFEEKYNREKLKEKVGMAIYRPQLSVVIGRSGEFRDEIDRAKLRSREPGIEIVTYDDILAYAKKRQITLGDGMP